MNTLFKNTAVRGEADLNFVELKELTGIYIRGQEANRYLEMLNALGPDIHEPGDLVYLGMQRAPAATGNHHAFEGGLVYHLLEMWAIWERLKPDLEAQPHISDERILKAIIHHDLHKAHRTYVLESEDPWKTRYGEDPTDMLMTNDTKSIWLLNQHGIRLDPEQMNALLWAEGGFAKIRPKQCTALSKLAYCLDELSGNVASRIYTKTLIDLKKAVP